MKGGLFRILQKGDNFFVSYNNQVLLGVISFCIPLLAPSRKRPYSLLQFGRGRNIFGHSFERKERNKLF